MGVFLNTNPKTPEVTKWEEFHKLEATTEAWWGFFCNMKISQVQRQYL